MAIKSKIKPHFIPLLFTLAALFIFFHRLFLPSPALFYTPDIGISDSLHLTYPLKHILHQSLRQFSLPFWQPNLATGFPLFAEGEIGTLYLPNLILYFLFPTWLAWNLSYLVSFILTFIGTYYLSRQFTPQCIANTLAALSFSFSAFFILHIPHHNMIQAAALLPWALLLTHRLLKQPQPSSAFLLSIILSQQFFVGHLQTSFITWVGISTFFFFSYFIAPTPKTLRSPILFLTSLASSIGLAAPQLFSTLQLQQLSGLASGSHRIFDNPFPPQHLLSYLLPNLFGTPQTATYPPPGQDWGIYWENVHYLGLIPILLFISSLPRFLSLRLRPSTQALYFSIPIFTLLALSKFTPLQFIFSFPGFNWFRVPARFLLITTLSIALLAAHQFHHLTRRLQPTLAQSLGLAVLLFILLDLTRFGANYHPTVPISTLLDPPAIVSHINPQDRYLTFTPFQAAAWNQQFYSQGWQNISPYLYFRNGLQANLNLLYHLQSAQSYTGLQPLRLEYFTSLLNSPLLDAASIKSIISPQNHPSLSIYPLNHTLSPPSPDLPSYYLYTNPSAIDRFHFVSKYQVMNQSQFIAHFQNQLPFDFASQAILETPIDQSLAPLTFSTINLQIDQPHYLQLSTITDQPALFIISDSFYPNWHATINGLKTPIFPANLNQRALLIPAGSNTINLRYIPYPFYLGLLIALITLVFWVSIFRHRLSRFAPLTLLRLFLSRPSIIFPSILIIICLGFFFHLFFPTPSFIFTPDAGGSDLTSFHFPIKNFLAESLKQLHLPLWNSQLGTGFPVFAEGQAGTFYLPNLILYFLFPTWLAFNVNYVFSFIILSLGSYALSRYFKLSHLASLLVAITTTYSGFFITHLIHPNMIQTTSLIPWIFLFSLSLYRHPTKFKLIALTIIFSQQLLAGYLQYTFITLIGLCIFLLLFFYLSPPANLRKSFTALFISFSLAFGLSSIQLLPTWELLQHSNRHSGLATQAIFDFPFHPRQLLTLIQPNYFGTPQTGDYPLPGPNQGFYWETTAYLGIIPLLLLLLALFKHPKSPLEKSLWLLLLISLLLSFGRYSPLSFLYHLPPFQLFRIPSRFLLLFVFAATLLSGTSLDHFLRRFSSTSKYLLWFLIITLASLDLLHFSTTYNAILPVDQITHPPPILSYLPSNSRYYTHPSHQLSWQQLFTNSGWQRPSQYLYLQNGLDANANLLFHHSNLGSYAGISPDRLAAFQQLLSPTLFNISSTEYLISTTPIESPTQFQLTQTISPPEPYLPSYYLYHNSTSLPRFRLASSSAPSTSARHTTELLASTDFDPNIPIVEQLPHQTFSPLSTRDIQLIRETSTQLILQTTTDQDSLLIIADSFYPGWTATIDSNSTTIYPANLNQRALLLPSGTHTVNLTFHPQSLYLGAIISGLTLLSIYLIAKPIPRIKPLTTQFT